MQIVNQVLTYLFAAVFIIFGLNYWLHFIPMPMPPEGSPAALFFGAIFPTGFLAVVKVIEVAAGGMIAANFRRPLAWLLILPICVGIVLFEVLISKQPGIGIALLAINFYMIYQNRASYPFLAQ